MFTRDTYAPRKHWGWLVVAALAAMLIVAELVLEPEEEPEASATAAATAERATPQPTVVRTPRPALTPGPGSTPLPVVRATAQPRPVATPAPRRTTPALTAAPAGACLTAAEEAYIGRVGFLFTELGYALADMADFVDVPFLARGASARFGELVDDRAALRAPASLRDLERAIIPLVQRYYTIDAAYARGDHEAAARAGAGISTTDLERAFAALVVRCAGGG